MSKFVIKFKKEGYIKYISHLDLVRVFHRAFKMGEFNLKYSEGFNPHPKMSFVQPLSLGYSSRTELLEFELMDNISCDAITKRLNLFLPYGIEILGCKEYLDKKTLSSMVEACRYKIYIPINISSDEFNLLLNNYFSRAEIIVEKESKKRKEIKLVNIKPMIKKLESTKVGDFIVVDTILDSGSLSNLSPELLITSLISFGNLNTHRYDIEVERLEIYFSNNFQF